MTRGDFRAHGGCEAFGHMEAVRLYDTWRL